MLDLVIQIGILQSNRFVGVHELLIGRGCHGLHVLVRYPATFQHGEEGDVDRMAQPQGIRHVSVVFVHGHGTHIGSMIAEELQRSLDGDFGAAIAYQDVPVVHGLGGRSEHRMH